LVVVTGKIKLEIYIVILITLLVKGFPFLKLRIHNFNLIFINEVGKHVITCENFVKY